jgi:hypothetical protein
MNFIASHLTATLRIAPQLNATILLAIYRRAARRHATRRHAALRNSTQRPNHSGR